MICKWIYDLNYKILTLAFVCEKTARRLMQMCICVCENMVKYGFFRSQKSLCVKDNKFGFGVIYLAIKYWSGISSYRIKNRYDSMLLGILSTKMVYKIVNSETLSWFFGIHIIILSYHLCKQQLQTSIASLNQKLEVNTVCSWGKLDYTSSWILVLTYPISTTNFLWLSPRLV